MKLNSDLGESFGIWSLQSDEKIMPYIDMANIACGFHASDPSIMLNTIRLAKQHHVSVGAHPGYPDLQGFGRRSMAFSPNEIYALILYQVGALAALCQSQQVKLEYVKPHGALYHDMHQDPDIFCAIVEAIHAYDPTLFLCVMATKDNDKWAALAQSYNIKLRFEAFADRAYGDDGKLIERSQSGAVYTDESQIYTQASHLINGSAITTLSGNSLLLNASTLCVHGDNPAAIHVIKQLKAMCDASNTES
ncbi:5-oxoprolinase subunit PxpA [Flocculibacter collagenilyticus]|uniref:5-oxoprolinase subunit PxpA n=1 Tax=Flocculibacter collagenilyticus TaxID=2744479 RepID=UPI0018F6035B|nr:5-oxoprolinase subunit PxpA [Flocculibacter collagenilyticus]